MADRNLLVDYVELVGPLDVSGEPTKARSTYYTCEPTSEDDEACAFEILEGFAQRAWLRPLSMEGKTFVRAVYTRAKAADASWEALAKKLCASHVSVSSFHFSTGNYVDLASQSILPRHTGGQLYLYANCVPEQRDEWCAKLQAELARNLMRSYGYEGVMRVRCSALSRTEGGTAGSSTLSRTDRGLAGSSARNSRRV